MCTTISHCGLSFVKRRHKAKIAQLATQLNVNILTARHPERRPPHHAACSSAQRVARGTRVPRRVGAPLARQAGRLAGSCNRWRLHFRHQSSRQSSARQSDWQLGRENRTEPNRTTSNPTETKQETRAPAQKCGTDKKTSVNVDDDDEDCACCCPGDVATGTYLRN